MKTAYLLLAEVAETGDIVLTAAGLEDWFLFQPSTVELA